MHTSSGLRRKRFTDITLTVLYVLVACGLGVLSREQPHVTPLWSMVTLTLAGFGVRLVHRRAPSLAFGAAMVLTLLSFAYGTGAEAFLVTISLYQLCATRSARAAWIALGITMLFGAVGSAILAARIRFGPSLWGVTIPSDSRDSLFDALNCFVIIGAIALIVALIGMNVGHRRRYVGTLVHRAEQMERERDQQAEISVARERERIAREMHDVIAHSLSVMIAMADGASAVALQRPHDAKQATGRISDTGRRTLDEVRRLLSIVRDDDASPHEGHNPQPDATQLPELVAEFATAGLPVQLEATGVASSDPGLGLTVYRIVQESLTNVLRHGRGVKAVSVQVDWATDEVTLLVEDTSLPAAPDRRAGRGTLGIRERAALYDGIVESGPLPAGGWRVSVRLQIEEH